MPKRNDIKKILVIGSGPIVIGQACEFDYSGTQACKALKEEGFSIILANSNPATIMTDPDLTDRTYIEPLTDEFLEKIIEKERPDAVLPTLGGQTGLNLALSLAKKGIFEKYGLEMLGADQEVIEKAEDRAKFKALIEEIGLRIPKSVISYTIEDALVQVKEIGYPCIVRPAFTLGGTGGGIVENEEELIEVASCGLDRSMISEILIEESIYGWKEYELEVMRDKNDNVVIICSIENLDPLGIHTGDSITVAPQQTLTDREYQEMRDAAIAIIRAVGVETGGANTQFAVNPKNGELVVIEVNPRVSRSSALASKATGFPIAKFAAKLAVGYSLDELVNDITKKTPACFEPTIDYCVVKIPRFNFKKFPGTPSKLGTSMKAVGEVMAIGRTFKESFQKGIRSLEVSRFGFGYDKKELKNVDKEELETFIRNGNPWRLYYIKYALEIGYTVEQLAELSKIDPWYLVQMGQIVDFSKTITKTPESIKAAKELGFSDVQIAYILGEPNEDGIREFRKSNNIKPIYSLVDTCAAEFEAETPYYYSTYETETEVRISDNKKVMILGGGPNRIGQGIEFDYCCVHASLCLREENVESIMVNSNPETVSTDFDISDKLYFEPLTFEDVMNIHDTENPDGVIIQFGGQTPLNLAQRLEDAGVTILGTSPKSIDDAEDRERFQSILNTCKLRQPENGTATNVNEAVAIANRIHYPVVVRPSYVLGGASMRIVDNEADLKTYVSKAQDISTDHPILIDKYLENALEIDVDGLSDGTSCVIAGIMQHIEQAGIHSGDSACCLPPYSLSQTIISEIREATYKLAAALNVIGLLNIQFAVKDNDVYILEVNPRASRTVPFVSKATGVPWAKMATKVLLGSSIKDLGLSEIIPPYYSVKEAVLPFSKFPNSDTLLSPEMKSTGESMGIDIDFSLAFYKSQLAAGQRLPKEGNVFISVSNSDKSKIVDIAKELRAIGFTILATSGTYNFLKKSGVESSEIGKIHEGGRSVIDSLGEKKVDLAFNTPSTEESQQDEIIIRQQLVSYQIPYVTTISAMKETVNAIKKVRETEPQVKALQDYISFNKGNN
ncbi:carbamoyl phosphate synthase large subunit [Candidatus Marinamargulisbacteria bacterium SCGC AAA071-K20]|nr:carbamoyl phosphate synthase large subunit [Candidatus Marinamargulisbacteria bacterium SCGC AAA071-K20]